MEFGHPGIHPEPSQSEGVGDSKVHSLLRSHGQTELELAEDIYDLFVEIILRTVGVGEMQDFASDLLLDPPLGVPNFGMQFRPISEAREDRMGPSVGSEL